MNDTFPDPNTVLGLDRMQEFLAANRPGAARRFCVLTATDLAGAVAGGTVFSYIRRSICGFSEYILVDRLSRGTGLGRWLFDGRKEVLDREANRDGHAGCRGLFIEADNPERVPGEFAAIERETSLDAWERLQLFDHLGFRRVDVAYVQPPLAPDKQPIDYLDLLFAPWPLVSLIPREWLLDTLEPVWSAWTPATAAAHLERLRQRVSGGDVRLLTLDSRPS